MTNCQSCGMPMEKPEDFGVANINNLYCKYCTDSQGNLLPKEVVRENMVQFNIKAYGKTREQAEAGADNLMNQMAAWNPGVSGIVEESQAVQPEEIPTPAPAPVAAPDAVGPGQNIYLAEERHSGEEPATTPESDSGQARMTSMAMPDVPETSPADQREWNPVVREEADAESQIPSTNNQ